MDEQKKKPASGWAKPVGRLQTGKVDGKAMNLNVSGRNLTGPLQGFGQMWQKTYRVRLEGVEMTPQEIISTWKEKFPQFWPKGNNFYGPLRSIEPGDVAVLNLAVPGGMKLSTGIMVIYADDESFSFMTPEGHMFAGMITFSAAEDEGTTVVQIQALIRASDPIYEIGCRLGFAHKMEDEFWHGTLTNLANYAGVQGPEISLKTTCVDNEVQWKEAKNVWHNSAIRSTLYMPVHLTKRLFGR
ncbi:MAG: hypothetical protein WAM60_24680 [Candidatus Promineifilaceae bacterium]